ncbi:MAG: UvrD-helicase domain-containing protein [Bacteroidetes bacterium]|nr:UvrD-helicase domain-containing protein [Bacteroidota bacterium]
MAGIKSLDPRPYIIYRSSAGSGKTRTLAKEFLLLALSSEPGYLKHILAVTFTNKATQEMKDRIVRYLADFRDGRHNNLRDELLKELGMDEPALKRKSEEVLSTILHEYSSFAVSTIDAFFQRVIRSFTREAGLLGNFRLEVDYDIVLDEVIAQLLDELGSDPQLTDWMIQFSSRKLQDGENWNVARTLKSFAMEIMKEQFKEIEEEVLKATPERHVAVRKLLEKESGEFMKAMSGMARQAMGIIEAHRLTKDDFKGKDRGTVFKYFREFAAGVYVDSSNPTMLSAIGGAGEWMAKQSLKYKELLEIAETELRPILLEMVEYEKTHGPGWHAATAILENYYSYGLISDITRKLQSYKEENNLMLLVDASKFLNGIIRQSDTPFVYEKVGSYFQNFLIDEFQDTSSLQWKNFHPLLKEAGDQGKLNLIVGDVKQSIYRWRGGDLSLLQSSVPEQFGAGQVDIRKLNRNFRSGGRVVSFNNKFFSSAAALLSMTLNHPLPAEVYADVAQEIFYPETSGFVEATFLERGEDDLWKKKVLDELPRIFERLQDQGVPLRDIAILVRRNDEGQEVANHLLRLQGLAERKRSKYKYKVVSNESLRVDGSYTVGLLLAALRYLHNPDDAVARGHLAYEVTGGQQLDTLFAKARHRKLDEVLPEEFLRQQPHLRRLSVFELTEELIRIFQLSVHTTEISYLQAFQDITLEFSSREKTDLGTFLEWWDSIKVDKKSIKVSDGGDAATILTIHKAKGLQFRYVIIPFCNWRMQHEHQSNMLWVQPKEESLSGLGHVAVRYGSDLAKTSFREEYELEKVKVNLDNLNLLYVAFTRAEAGLMVFAPRPGESSKGISSVNDLMYAVMNQPELSHAFDGSTFRSGSLEEGLMVKESAEALETIQLDRYHSCDWRKKLVIKREGAEFFEDEISEARTKINRGILVHRILSLIRHQSDAETALDSFFLEVTLLPEEQKDIRDKVMSVVQHPQIGQWYGKEWDVRNEALVLLPGGGQKRMDRLMVGKKQTIVVDYKTGARKAADRAQVEQYAGVLARMGYPAVTAYLLYLDDLHVEEVVRNTTLGLF